MKYSLSQLRSRNPKQTEGGILLSTYINKKRTWIGLGISVPFKEWDQILNYTKNTTIGNEVPNLVQNVWSLLPQPTPNLCVFEFSLSHRAKEPLRTMTIG